VTEALSPYFTQTRAEMLRFVPSGAASILEVGCGAGSFGAELRKAFPDACLYGIESNPVAARRAEEIYDRLWVGEVCDILRRDSDIRFDVIVMNDLLEHLVDPWHCLELCRGRMAPEGRVVASVPNMRFWPILSDLLFQCDWRYREAGVMDRTHLRFFTEKSIRRLFDESGYRIVELEGINRTWKISVRWRILNFLLLGRLRDCLFPQFAVVAAPEAAGARPQ